MAHSITELEQAYAALERKRRRRGGGEVKGARCPQNSVVVGPLFESATGCTEEEAKRKLHRKLLDRSKKARDDIGSPCRGECPDGGTCVLTVGLNPENQRCQPAELDSCPDKVGYLCTYAGTMTATCFCAL